MNDDYIVTVYTIVDDLLQIMNYQDDVRASLRAAEIITIAIVAAKYFQNHHERAVCLMYQLGYISKLSVSRFSRRIHALLDWIWHLHQLLGDVFSEGNIFIIDAMPLPVCQRVRAKRCKKVTGRDYYGYCASKEQRFFGWQLHLVCDSHGIPVAFDILPARFDELVPVQHLLATLPDGSTVLADKGYISYKDQLLAWLHGNIRLITKFRKNMIANSEADAQLLREHRPTIETLNSQLEKMGIQRLHARSNKGFFLKVFASLIAVTFTNLNL